tara:strand:+ start:89 stop:673 length:585 start_codon:yes stop_codon:yes gene_type:complete
MALLRTLSIIFLLAGHSLAQGSKNKPQRLIDAARSKIGVTLVYDPSYQAIKYPMGDVASDRGVCSDVVIRAFRKGLEMDLQNLVHLDMRNNFSKYPDNWGLKKTDRNIDHRRVPNLKTYFTRKGWKVPVTKNKNDYKPGDLVICRVAGRLPHIMIVSDKKSSKGVPLVIHNIGRGTREEDTLFTYPIYGHFRIK